MANVGAIDVTSGRGKIRIQLDQPRTVKLSAEPAGEVVDRLSRAVQIKLAETLPTGGKAELKYEILTK